jgi:primosomal protein N'
LAADPAEPNQVPDDEKVAFQVKFGHQRKLALNLASGTVSEVGLSAAVSSLESFTGALAQKRHHRLAFRDGIAWKFISQIVERKLEPRRELFRVLDRGG